MSPSLEPFRFATSNLLVGVQNWKSYNSVATTRFDRRNGKTQPKAERHALQLKHSGAQKLILPLLFDLQHRFEAA